MQINIYEEYHGYFSLLMMAFLGIYFYRNKKYEKIIIWNMKAYLKKIKN